ncbi:adenylate/guanylate cyclase domain-containing protein [Ruegeria sp. 1NDH52C]|uniref:Adenylate/guanylate cyclase domain-containing protein n=1 Tax=Ruegeria alba TaxID=2916756 RepID=A0ABS9P2A5_9RHOB|nr:adenylate/guanylate cyclase domain-containing protein [Ruegeria alba]MCG6560608.1 adenylate/guanylate cyclase domain-containing protein [Ruegeria alba]
MAKDQSEFNLILPRWLAWYLGNVLEGKPPRQQRRELTVRLAGAFGIVSSTVHGVYYLLHDSSLWPASAGSVVLGTTCYFLPRVLRLGETVFTIFVSLVINGCFVFYAHALGLQNGIILFFLIVPALHVLIVGPKWLWLTVLSIACCSLSILYCYLTISEPALPAANDPTFQLVTLSMAAVAPIAIIAASVFFSVSRADRAEDALEAEHARSEALLYNLLPSEIAARLKAAPDQTIADSLPKVAILFADIVNFTPRSAQMQPEEIVEFLNRIFTEFDHLAEKHELEKIKTIGDAYMVAAGMPNPCGDPVHRVAAMALDMHEVAKGLPDNVELRIGLHAGPAVAGVIGNRKLFYDVWGETVNTASRMESHGEPGRIQVTAAAKAELEGDYTFEPRGTVMVKGMGEVETWWLSGSQK